MEHVKYNQNDNADQIRIRLERDIFSATCCPAFCTRLHHNHTLCAGWIFAVLTRLARSPHGTATEVTEEVRVAAAWWITSTVVEKADWVVW